MVDLAQIPPTIRPVQFAAAGARAASLHQFYLSGEDNLRVQTFSRFSPLPALTITGRFWKEAENEIQVFQFPHVTGFAPTGSQEDFRLDRGALLNLRISTPVNNDLKYGYFYARAQIIRGLGPNATVLATILQGYLTPINELGWPGSPIQSTMDGLGSAYGVDWLQLGGPLRLSNTVPSFVRWRATAGLANFVSSAVAGVRTLVLQVLDVGGNAVFQQEATPGVGAGAAVLFTFGQATGFLTTTANGRGVWTYPNELDLPGNSVLQVLVLNEQAGDTFSQARLHVREWLDM